MVNRVLIRMKVVQLLYSYLLTKSDFKIKEAPARQTKDNAFAHVVYIDLLLMLLELSGYNTAPRSQSFMRVNIPSNPRLHDSAIMRALAANDDIRAIIAGGQSSIEALRPALDKLYAAITNSDFYKKYLRARTRGPKEDSDFWRVMIETVIKPSEAFEKALRTLPDFTVRGYEAGVEAVLDTLADYADERNTLTAARNALDASLAKAYELYQAILCLPVTISRAYEERVEVGRNKFLPSSSDLNPDTSLITDKLVEQLLANPVLTKYLETHTNEWDSDHHLITRFLDSILGSEEYARYKALEAHTVETDSAFWRHVLKEIVLPDNDLAEALESKSIYWNDDLEIMSTFALKTLKRYATDPEHAFLPQFKDAEDAAFGPTLFMDVVEHAHEYRSLIDTFVEGRDWGAERLAFMDVVIMQTAIAEILNFPQIPVPVTLNEYIEIAKSYSTPKSGKFINGVLFAIINKLKEEGRLRR